MASSKLLEALAALAAARERASKGQWEYTGNGWLYQGGSLQVFPAIQGRDNGFHEQDAKFIALASGFDFAALLAEATPAAGVATQPAPLADAEMADWIEKLEKSRAAFAAWDGHPNGVTALESSDEADIELGRATCEYLPDLLARLRHLEAQVAAGAAKLLRAENELLDAGVALGRYEGGGELVYPGDDYVVDAEGCYLTREQASELSEEGGQNG